jgi:alpha-L-fucosidase 2
MTARELTIPEAVVPTRICARGGFEISMKWKNSMLTNVTVLSKAGNNCYLNYKDKTVKIETEKGNTYFFDAMLKLKK